MLKPKKHTAVLAIAAVVLLPLLLWQIAVWTERVALRRVADQAASTLALYATGLQEAVGKYEALPRLLARDPTLAELLRTPDDAVRRDRLNRALEEVNAIAGTADTYLLDRDGLTLAASNWNGPTPFVGRNYSYRPYFQQAMEGRLGRYVALGTASGKRGYYFAYPVRETGGDILGAITVKVLLEPLEAAWPGTLDRVIVTDSVGVILMSSRDDWRYRTLAPLSESELSRILAQQQYTGASLAPLPLTARQAFGARAERVELGREADRTSADDGQAFLLQSFPLEAIGLTVWSLSPVSQVRGAVTQAIVLAAFGFLIVLGLTWIWLQRRLAIRERFETDQRHKAELEGKVAERTRALETVNADLRAEVAERQRTERELRETQAELVQAAKMAALGQLSAGIGHELNQPLGAIRSYADNAKVLLERDRLPEVEANLTQISGITGRMAEIVRRLKTFARKPSHKAEAVCLRGALDDALALMESRIDGERIEIEVPAEGARVQADPVRLQQTLVNLIGNALDALAGAEAPCLRFAAEPQGGQVALQVIDNGPGIAEEALDHVFDPFYTTKDPGQGLGLGLSISYNILRDLGGSLAAHNRPEGGACFTLTLPQAAPAHATAPPSDAADLAPPPREAAR